MTVALTFFDSFKEAVSEKVHNLGSDALMVALTNTAPVAGTTTKLADVTEISYTNCSSRAVTTTSSVQTSGTYKLVLATLTLTASGAVGPFQYVVLYNNTATNKEAIGFYNYGSAVTMASGDTFAIDFAGASGVLTLA